MRSNLTSRADSYPAEVFDALLACKREKEALGLAELLTNPLYKVKILVNIAEYIRKLPGREQESLQLLMRTYEIVGLVDDAGEKALALLEVGLALARGKQEAQVIGIWSEAIQVACSIENAGEKTKILRNLSRELILAQQWKESELAWRSIVRELEREQALRELRAALMEHKQWILAEKTAHSIANWRERSEAFRKLAQALTQEREWDQAMIAISSIAAKELRIEAQQEISQALIQEQRWEIAIKVARSIRDARERALALREVGVALQHIQQETRIEVADVWNEALKAADSISKKKQRTEILQDFNEMFIRMNQWELAAAAARSIEGARERGLALCEV